MFYLIKETLEKCKNLRPKDSKAKYVAVLSTEEWLSNSSKFDMGIDLEVGTSEIHSTKAEVNYDSLTGTFSIPDRHNIAESNSKFAFALDEKGIVFIDDSGTVEEIISGVVKSKRWTNPSLERFIYDFLEQIIYHDQSVLAKYDAELDEMEDKILAGEEDNYPKRLSEIRSDLRDMRIHYEQLEDLGQELEENENNFFAHENLRYFHLFTQRIARLHDTTAALRDYTAQIRELYQSQLDIKQNRIMTILTIVTTIFMPLTLIAGWYGMNFKYMPELEFKAAYPIVIAVSIVIVILSLVFFRKKKWL
ncbi:CorA family divalent cation transporter [Ruminococcus flavefaciens]|uniref:magnesium transporter CorA family protein n=1 Tax=Ruminococcus flavefaciens TaxID=1265 RepID=UPI0026F1CB90|nr:CorA family divalent cation transporter [Ruminococcus flavefaciens]MDD7518136.1 CorA family divalent cation transporter [Ruminococcus flavefaciens]MDY5691409.1 CorA family divalent cation transporter [Ruminococcus flavefaciens]